MSIETDIARDLIIKGFHTHWELNDRGHRAEHFEEVFQTAKHINEKLELGYKEIDMLFAAYFHDLFAWSRINHHTLAYQYFMTTDHALIEQYYKNNKDENGVDMRVKVAFACLEHRASYKGSFTFKFSELINSADRGFAGNTQELFNRVIRHHTDIHPGKSVDEVRAISLAFIKRKAGSQGYCRYPDMYFKVFAEDLKRQQEEIDNLE